MNIAYLTSEYKDYRLKDGDVNTNISNSFCREWVKQGHRVIAIHNVSRFPKIIYKIPRSIKKAYESRFGSPWGSFDAVKQDKYYDDGVVVYRLPIRKYIPHSSPSNGALDKQAKKIISVLRENAFIPDVIIGQWVSPQSELIYRLVDYYPDCKSGVVLHGNTYIYDKKFPTLRYFSKIDHVGTRSETHAISVMNNLSLEKKPFVCYSGFPDEYIESFHLSTSKFLSIKKWKFVFVGRLVEYKKVDVIIQALNKLKGVDWELNIVGEGGQLTELKKMCGALKCEDRVVFHGKVNRARVMEILSDCHCFVMVSVGEVFGLVYLEAMGASCISVGSKGAGIDGVILDKQNGFLSSPGDVNELASVLKCITTMTSQQLIEYVTRGYETACNFSDSNVAKWYLDEVMKD